MSPHEPPNLCRRRFLMLFVVCTYSPHDSVLCFQVLHCLSDSVIVSTLFLLSERPLHVPVCRLFPPPHPKATFLRWRFSIFSPFSIPWPGPPSRRSVGSSTNNQHITHYHKHPLMTTPLYIFASTSLSTEPLADSLAVCPARFRGCIAALAILPFFTSIFWSSHFRHLPVRPPHAALPWLQERSQMIASPRILPLPGATTSSPFPHFFHSSTCGGARRIFSLRALSSTCFGQMLLPFGSPPDDFPKAPLSLPHFFSLWSFLHVFPQFLLMIPLTHVAMLCPVPAIFLDAFPVSTSRFQGCNLFRWLTSIARFCPDFFHGH